MKFRFIQAAFVLVLLAAPVALFAQTIEDKIKEVDAYAQKVRADWNVPGLAVAIVKDDKVIFAKGYGIKELGKTDAVDENSLFAIGSNTKAFTTATLATLVDEGKVKWDDPVTKYLPEFQMYDPYVTREITIRDICSHRSGLATFSGDLIWYLSDLTTDEILYRVRFLKPATSFRSAYGYQNLMFMAAGKVIEKVTGKTWQQAVAERILRPIGMNKSTTSPKDFKAGDNYAMPHSEIGGKGMHSIPYMDIESGAAAGAINSSVMEMSRWLRLQLGRGTFEGKKVFSEARSYELWQQNTAMPVSKASTEMMPSKHFQGYGLGWGMSDYLGRKIVSHGGGLPGMISQTAMVPEEKFGLVVLSNSESLASSVLMNKILDVFLGGPQRDWSAEYLARTKAMKEAIAKEDQARFAARIPNTKPSLDVSGYAGTYNAQIYGDATVTVENGKLVLRFSRSAGMVADLEHFQYDTFQLKWRPSVSYNFRPGYISFTIDAKGRTDQMSIDQPNNDFLFTELEFRRK